MPRRPLPPEAFPFAWVEISESALRRLRRELEQKGQGVVDEMGVLAIHTGYADYFFPGTSVLQTRPRYLFFICWNLLWLAQQPRLRPGDVRAAKDNAELWLTSQLIATEERQQQASGALDMDGIIGKLVFRKGQVPVQPLDFIYWTALRKWDFYRSRTASERARLFRRWKGKAIRRVGDAYSDEDDMVVEESLAEFYVPQAPPGWRTDEIDGLDFDLLPDEAVWLRDRLVALPDVKEGPCLLAKAAALCSDASLMSGCSSRRPWDDPLLQRAALEAGQLDRLERAKKASILGHQVRAIYAALVEWVAETTASSRPDPPHRFHRETLIHLAKNSVRRHAVLSLSLEDLYSDVPRIGKSLRRVLAHVQDGLRRIESNEDVESVFINDETHRYFEIVERQRKTSRARLPRTEQAAVRRADLDSISTYDLDYRYDRVRTLLTDLHRGLCRP